jgi:hypothetical protein
MVGSAVVVAVALVGCSKSATEKKEKTEKTEDTKKTDVGSAAPAGSGSGGSAGSAEAPPEAATVVGPTKSATGTLEVSGAITGSFEWKKKDQKSPISCAWDAEKEIGGLHVDVSDGAGKLIQLGIDIPPAELGAGRLDASSKDLPATLKTFTGFKVSGDGEGHMTVKFDDTRLVTDPDAQLKAMAGKKYKKPDKPAAGELAIKGTIEVTCPKKK